MRDITLEDTFRHGFTTRAFGTGVPTTLSGTPVISVLEENNATPITSGVSISVDRASVAGLNEVTIIATAANGYESGKGYTIYISTGTVSSVSAVGEVVGAFTISASAAAVDLANVTDGLGAIKSDTAEIGTAGVGLTDVSLSTAGILAIWDQLTSALTTASTIGKLIIDMAGATFSTATDSLEALRNRGDTAWTTGAGGTPPDLLQSTTIATLSTQTSFTLTAGSADNDAYNNMVVVITDASTSTQKAVARISDYVGSTKTITLEADPAIFTMATGDTIDIVAKDPIQPVTVENINTQVGTAGVGLTAINLPNQTMDITGNITGNVTGSVGSVTGAVGSVSGNVDGNVTGTVGSISSPGNIFTTQMTESYAADGVAPTLAQSLFLMQSDMLEFSHSGTTKTTKQLDGTTTAATYTYDSSSAPTTKTRAT